MHDLHYTFRIGHTTISTIIRMTCEKLWEVLMFECFPVINTELLEEISQKFYKYANFPHCVGAIDGKHIRIIKPDNSASTYYNYKDFFSFVLMAVVDADYCFVFVDIGAPGSNADSTIFKNTTFWNALNSNSIKLPNEKILPGSTLPPVPYVFVADEAFGLHQNIMRPYGGQFLSVQKRVFNYRLSRARRYVECAFGILSNKWRILNRALDVSLPLSIDIVKACCILHNFVRKRDGHRIREEDFTHNLESIQIPPSIRSGRQANNIRDVFQQYFMSDSGALSWQLNQI